VSTFLRAALICRRGRIPIPSCPLGSLPASCHPILSAISKLNQGSHLSDNESRARGFRRIGSARNFTIFQAIGQSQIQLEGNLLGRSGTNLIAKPHEPRVHEYLPRTGEPLQGILSATIPGKIGTLLSGPRDESAFAF
jgi:hypothetical protein